MDIFHRLHKTLSPKYLVKLFERFYGKISLSQVNLNTTNIAMIMMPKREIIQEVHWKHTIQP